MIVVELRMSRAKHRCPRLGGTVGNAVPAPGLSTGTPLQNWTEIPMTAVRVPLVCVFVLLSVLNSAVRAAEPFFFIQLSDPQLGMFTADRDFTQDTANFEFAVTAVNRLKPAFVVITGDLVNKPGDAAQIREYRRIVGTIDRSIPVYNVAGNHDVENVPTPESLAAYERLFGPARYTFRHGGFTGIVLNSSLIHSPQKAAEQLAEQDRWLRTELAKARAENPQHLVVFQHHPWFLKTATEADEYFNIPTPRRAAHLALFREFGVHYLFCGHYHRNAEARDGSIEAVTSGPVGKPLGNGRSGIRVAIVRDEVIEHRYYELSELPTTIALAPPAPKKKM
ncbi:MAG TPA: metallophosphoesterase [Opitutaceae bacterium]